MKLHPKDVGESGGGVGREYVQQRVLPKHRLGSWKGCDNPWVRSTNWALGLWL
jgi:hypothetical protein